MARAEKATGEAVGVVFSPGGRVYSFDPAGLELAWNEKVICQTSRGQEYGRVVKPNHQLETGAFEPAQARRPPRDGSGPGDRPHNQIEAKKAMLVFRELVRREQVEVKPISAEMVFDGSRLVFAYESEGRPEVRSASGGPPRPAA